MPGIKPTLRTLIVRHHLLAASVTLIVILLGLLFLTDHLALRRATRVLVQELDVLMGENAVEMSLMDCCRPGYGRGGRLVLDADGRPLRGRQYRGGQGMPMDGACMMGEWDQASTVLAHGQLHGAERLPWASDAVIWVARAVQTSAGEPRILLVWSQINSVRAATGLTYLLVAGSTLFAFLVSLLLTMRTARHITGAITHVTESGRRMAEGDFRIRLPEQATVELDEMATVISDLAHNLDGTLADLREEHRRLEQLEGLQRQFVADASHELRAPLAAMSLTLDAWRDGLLDAAEQPEAIEQLRREAKRLGAMVGQLLDLARIESGRDPITLAPVPVAAVLREVAAAFHVLPGAPVHVQIAPELPQSWADRDALYRVLYNLVENARRFTPAEGSITLHAELAEGMIRLAVTDTGSGIAPADLAHIWDRFARAERTRADGLAGSGLGLAIVKALVTAMGGETGAESAPGQGTTIWCKLPLA